MFENLENPSKLKESDKMICSYQDSILLPRSKAQSISRKAADRRQ
jgi:hypothetical protein